MQRSSPTEVGKNSISQYQAAFLEEARWAVENTDTLQPYIERLKVQWRLPNVDAQETLSEAISRGVRYIADKNKAIINPIGWLRVVSLNIIRDESKAVQREKRLQERLSYEYGSGLSDPFEDSDFLEEVEALKLAMNTLSDGDQAMLKHRFFAQQRYKEIQATLEEQEGKKTSIAALRKRESRALKRLKEKFLQLQKENEQSA